MAADTRSLVQMRFRIRVAIRLAAKSGETTDTLQSYYARLSDSKRPVPTELYVEMAQIVPPLRFLVLDGNRE
jgi:hypothetical protein